MATKGASNRYGNTRGSSNNDKKTKNVNFAWAKGFNRGGIKRHFEEHGKEFNCKSKEEYEAKAIRFANTIDNKNCKVVVDYRGTTYKYDINQKVLVEVTKDGYIISYRHFSKKDWYMPKKGVKKWIK